MERSHRQRLIARPACPAPITTVVTLRMAVVLNLCGNGPRDSIHYNCDIRRVGYDVIDCRPLLRLRDESLDIFAFCIGVDLVGHLDTAEAIAHVIVYAENALEVHIP